jgi:hypothetical protein
MAIEARYAASASISSTHASDVFGGVSGEVCGDRSRQVFGMNLGLVGQDMIFTNLALRFILSSNQQYLTEGDNAKINLTPSWQFIFFGKTWLWVKNALSGPVELN